MANPDWTGGAPGDKYPEKRCKAIAHSTGVQCNKWIVGDGEYCRTHRGRFSSRQVRTLARVSLVYRRLGRKLKDAVEEQLGESAEAQLSLLEELAITRALADDAIHNYEDACEKVGKAKAEATAHADEPSKKEIVRKILEASEVMQRKAELGLLGTLQIVRETCVDAARVRASLKGVISPADLQHVVNQVIAKMYTVCGDENAHLAERLERELADIDLLPTKQNGTSLLPGETVSEMDSLTLGE